MSEQAKDCLLAITALFGAPLLAFSLWYFIAPRQLASFARWIADEIDRERR
ncbi:MAG: hypothetical protein ACHQ6V_17760 [Myxococcota bacterium]